MRWSRSTRRIRVVRTTRGGVARARNLGTENARGDLVAFLDHDDAWYPGHLAATVDALARDESAVASFTAMEVVRGPSRDHVRISGVDSRVDRHSVLSGGRRPSLNTMVIRREAMEAVGGFDPRFEGADDLDLVYKLVEEGSYAYVDAVTVVYRLHDENWSRDTRRHGRRWRPGGSGPPRAGPTGGRHRHGGRSAEGPAEGSPVPQRCGRGRRHRRMAGPAGPLGRRAGVVGGALLAGWGGEGRPGDVPAPFPSALIGPDRPGQSGWSRSDHADRGRCSIRRCRWPSTAAPAPRGRGS